jgi:L-malate glycosyltransferase
LKILFESRGAGLGPNGGSSTIVKSANALVKLGHDVTIIDSVPNQHTWTKLIANHLIPLKESDIPSSDVVIATGFRTVKYVLHLPTRCGKKYHWIRGWETWQMNEKEILLNVLNSPTIKIVNSMDLQDKLLEFGVQSYIIYPGNDLEEITPNRKDNGNKTIILGGLYNIRHKTKRTPWILETVKYIKKQYGKKIKLWMFGVHPDPKLDIIDKYFYSPSIKDKNCFYNNVTIMLSPSNLEGLHIVPQEAMLAECAVVTTNTFLGGTRDYVLNGETGLITDDVLIDFQKAVKVLIQDPILRNKIGKGGRQKILELGSREKNMNEMVQLFQDTM